MQVWFQNRRAKWRRQERSDEIAAQSASASSPSQQVHDHPHASRQTLLHGLSASLPLDPWYAVGCSSHVDAFYRHPLSSGIVVRQDTPPAVSPYTDSKLIQTSRRPQLHDVFEERLSAHCMLHGDGDDD